MIEVSKLPVQTKVSKRKNYGENERFKNRIIVFGAIYFVIFDFCSIHCLGQFTIAFI